MNPRAVSIIEALPGTIWIGLPSAYTGLAV